MKILIVGTWTHPMYEKSIADALSSQGHCVVKFSWEKYFNTLLGRFEEKYCINGLITKKFNEKLVDFSKNFEPDILLIWRGVKVLPSTMIKLRRLKVQYISSYNHDDFTGPSSGAPVPWHHKLFWRNFLRCAPFYDSHFVKRQLNIEHLKSLGAKRAFIMPMWFVKELHKPVKLSQLELLRFETDVVFVGHYEPDGRELSLRALIEAGIKVKLWGGHYWSRVVLGDLYDRLAPIVPAEGDDYAKALCGAKICLCFLSKLNRDTYTRRCFEIPACGGLMLAERTDDLLSFFKEDEEACFFSSKEELVQKAQWLLHNPQERERIAAAGLRRVWFDGHDVNSRAQQFISVVNQ
jgi:spore maturation protein CgeB